MTHRRVALFAAVALAVLGLGACKGDAKLHIYTLAPDAGSVPGYKGGTPITLADGTSVTLPDGTKVTTPTIPKNRTASSVGERETPSTTAKGATTPGATTTSTYLVTTGTTSRTAEPADTFAFPKPGVYQFHDTVRPDDGSPGADKDSLFTYSSPAPNVVRVQDGNSSGYYEERHDADGLWLITSQLSTGACRWDPKSALLPQKVIEGGSVSTTATCTAGGLALQLETRVAFKVIRDITIAGRSYRAIDVTRHRVLSDGESTITSDAVDTYAFELGIRVATSEHTTTQTDKAQSGLVRNLVLVSLPA